MIVCSCFNVTHNQVDSAIDALRDQGVPEEKITPGLIHQKASGQKSFAKGCAGCCRTIAERKTKRERPFLIPAA